MAQHKNIFLITQKITPEVYIFANFCYNNLYFYGLRIPVKGFRPLGFFFILSPFGESIGVLRL